jgi:hypothetical protein
MSQGISNREIPKLNSRAFSIAWRTMWHGRGIMYAKILADNLTKILGVHGIVIISFKYIGWEVVD